MLGPGYDSGRNSLRPHSFFPASSFTGGARFLHAVRGAGSLSSESARLLCTAAGPGQSRRYARAEAFGFISAFRSLRDFLRPESACPPEAALAQTQENETHCLRLQQFT